MSTALTNPGIVVPAVQADRNFLIPDAAVTCSECDTDPAALHHPVLVIEILSPSNHIETWRNIRAYMLIDSVREIPVIHTALVRVDVLRRGVDGAWPDDVTPITQGDFTLASIELNVSLGVLYRSEPTAYGQARRVITIEGRLGGVSRHTRTAPMRGLERL